MRLFRIGPAAIVLLACAIVAVSVQVTRPYPWLSQYRVENSIASRFPPPSGFEREMAVRGSFADWLRNLPLKEGKPAVRLYDGRPKSNQDVHAAVVDIDTGTRDLQQCADAVIRLRAEYLYSRHDLSAIRFNFTSGDPASFLKWSEGFRAAVSGNRVSWLKTAPPSDSYDNFRMYLNVVFTYAGTLSLEGELQKVTDLQDLRGGDVFIQGGNPGHAVIVVDVAKDRGGRKVFLLAQSYMPAQDIHILRNPSQASSAWYDVHAGSSLRTPEWTFPAGQLRRFAE